MERKGDWMQTYTGRQFWPLDPRANEVDIRDIAHSLLLRRLGQGGMGEVWEADQPAMGRKVAIKLLQPSLASDPAYLSRFEREARAAGQLNHPSIVTLYETGRAEGRCYLAMELLDGETLAQRLQREGPLPLRQALAIWLPIAQAMAVAHQRGVVHRDLKPENIFLPQATTTQASLQVKVLAWREAESRFLGMFYWLAGEISLVERLVERLSGQA